MYRDIRFEFFKDDPFLNDTNKEKRNSLISYMDANLNIFSEKSPENISFLYIDPSITQLFGEKITENNKYHNDLINKMKSFIERSQTMPDTLKATMRSIERYIPPAIISEDTDSDEEIEQDDNIPGENDNQGEIISKNINQEDNTPEENFGAITPLIPEKFNYSRTSGLTNYDISTNKPLSYDEVRKLTINIARSELVPLINNESYKMKLEEQKRLELQETINKYRKIREIGALTQDDISMMNITQLTELAQTYKKVYEEKKLYNVLKKGGNILTQITSTIFPNGIRISKDEKTGKEKYIKMNGAFKEIINQIFDSSSVQGHAFGNLIKKSNINISDSVLAVISVAETIISNIQVSEIQVQQKKSLSNDFNQRLYSLPGEIKNSDNESDDEYYDEDSKET